MGLLNFFKDHQPIDLANELFNLASKVRLTDLEMQVFRSSSIDVEKYIDEKLMMQMFFVQMAVYSIAMQKSNFFIKDAVEIYAEKCNKFQESKNYFGYEDKYSMKYHINDYYGSGVPEDLLKMLFHAIRQQTLIDKDDRLRSLFQSSIDEFVSNLRSIIVPHLKRLKL